MNDFFSVNNTSWRNSAVSGSGKAAIHFFRRRFSEEALIKSDSTFFLKHILRVYEILISLLLHLGS